MDRFCIFIIDMCKVCGMGVVVRVKILMLVLSCFKCFLCLMLKCCFLLIIKSFRFLNWMFLDKIWWVFIMILILLFKSFWLVFFNFLVVLKCDIRVIVIGKFLKWVFIVL